MTIEEFSKGSTFIHGLDPRVKIISAVLFSIIVALADKFTVLAAALAASMLLILLARLSPARLASRLLIINTFILALWLVLPFSYAGQPVFHLGPLTATREGLEYALVISMKSNAIVLVMIALLATSPIFALVHALSHMRFPSKLIQLLFFTFRYFHVLNQEYTRLRGAMRIRSFKARTNMHTYKNLAYLVGMLLVRGFDRSEKIYQAMLCRGYQGRFWVFTHFSLNSRDVAFLIIMIGFSAILGAGQWLTRM
ncbi:MAG: cobalt ECF transporter T component CbiQ [Deltaproteobacteria bacterium]|nr:cobalt ECF transporter T component CbiQ [Deltaproteobacteria bacterium]